MTTPKLWQRSNADGAPFGSYHVTIKKRRINLRTQDVDTARKRRVLAMRGQTRFRDDSQGAADRIIAALDATPTPSSVGAVDGAARTEGDSDRHGAPPPLALGPMPDLESVIEPEPIAQEDHAHPGDWTADVGAAATTAGPEQQQQAPVADGQRVRIADLPLLATLFVSLSRLVVQLQIAGQVLAARKLARLDVPTLSDPPPKDLAEFLAQQGQPWPATDPREPGRQLWEGFFRRICPEDLPIPDWALAPIVVAAATLPVQLAHAERIDPKAPKPAPAPPAEGAAPVAAAA